MATLEGDAHVLIAPLLGVAQQQVGERHVPQPLARVPGLRLTPGRRLLLGGHFHPVEV